MEEGSATIEQFLHYLKFEKRFSEHTAKCYGADLVQFGEFLLNGSGAASAHGVGLGHHDTGAATAVATRTEQEIDQRLLAVDVNEARSYLAHLSGRGTRRRPSRGSWPRCAASTSTW